MSLDDILKIIDSSELPKGEDKKEIEIADSLKPTFENVAREFITKTLYKILYSNEMPNFTFDFRENEAIEFIEKTLQDYRNEYTDKPFDKELKERILQKLREKSNNNNTQPVMIVKDYKKFFEMLRQFYERNIELFFLRTKNPYFPVYEKEDIISEIKTERFIYNVKRLLSHYPNGEIKSYPGDVDSFLHLSIPVVKSENEINGDILREFYRLVKEKYLENER